MSTPGLQNKFLKAKFLTNKGQTFDAIKLYEEILKKYPNNSQAKDSLIILKKKSLNHITADLIKNLEVSYEKSEFFKALYYCEEIFKHDQSNSKAWSMCGAIYTNLKNFKKAIFCFKKFTELEPKKFSGYYNLTLAYIKSNLYFEALETIELALKIDEKSSRAFYTKGYILEKLNSNKAVEFYKYALSINPNNVNALLKLGDMCQSNKNFNDAIVFYEKIISVDPKNYIVLNNKAKALFELNKKKEAIKNYEQALLINPNYSDAINNLAQIKKNEKNLNASIKLFKRAIELEPKNGDAFNNLANTELEQGSIEEALENYKNALALNSNNKINIFINFYQIIIQSNEMMKKYNEVYKNFLKIYRDELYLNPLFLILNSIHNLIENNIDIVKKNLKLIEGLNIMKSITLNKKEKKFCIAYYIFLKKITKYKNIKLKDNFDYIYHIGDSHSLSFNQTSIVIDNMKYVIKPLLVIGAKSYHFAKEHSNSYKALVKLNLNKLPLNSKILVSFGEIDCRFDEGIILAAEKLRVDINYLIENTTKSYLKWFYENINQKENLFFFNIPAPVYNQKINKLLNKKVANVVRKFNFYLSKFADDFKFNIIDIYKHTSKNDFSNKLFHIDDFHLDRRIFEKILYNLKK